MNRGLLPAFGKRVKGREATRSIVNFFSAGGAVSGTAVAGTPINNARSVFSGPLVANTLRKVLEIRQPGECAFLSAYSVDSTSRTVRLRVWVDGHKAFDAVSGTLTVSNHGILAAGCGPVTGTGASVQQAVPIRWNHLLVVEIASSLSETDKVGVAYSALTLEG